MATSSEHVLKLDSFDDLQKKASEIGESICKSILTLFISIYAFNFFSFVIDCFLLFLSTQTLFQAFYVIESAPRIKF